MSSVFRVRCYKCNEIFYPLGKLPMLPPAYISEKCPNCHTVNFVIFDPELKREFARRELGLDKADKIERRVVELEKCREASDKEIEALKKQVEELQTALSAIISPEYRKKVADEIVAILAQIKSEPPKEMYRG